MEMYEDLGRLREWPEPPAVVRRLVAAAPALPYVVLDVAGSYQGRVDWRTAEQTLAARYPGTTMPAGIAKLSEGLTFTDAHGVANVAELRRLGKVGVGYHALRSAEPERQAERFAALLAACEADGWMLDWETFGSPPDNPEPAVAVAFVKRLQAITSRPGMIYTAAWFTDRWAPLPAELTALPLQLGNPRGVLPKGWASWLGWQVGIEESLPGVANGRSDINRCGPEWLAYFTKDNNDMAPRYYYLPADIGSDAPDLVPGVVARLDGRSWPITGSDLAAAGVTPVQLDGTEDFYPFLLHELRMYGLNNNGHPTGLQPNKLSAATIDVPAVIRGVAQGVAADLAARLQA